MTEAADVRVETASAVVGRFNAAWNHHDLDAALEMISDGCVFDATSPAPDGGKLHRQAAIRAAWKPIFDDPSGHFQVEESFTADPHVVVRWRYHRPGGHRRGIDVVTVADGKITRKLAYVKA